MALFLLLSILLQAVLMGAYTKAGNGQDTVYLAYVEDFKIMVLADLQFLNAEECEAGFILIDKMVAAEAPHLIVLTGDNVMAPNDMELVEQWIAHMESYGIPWAPVFGNHDTEGGVRKGMFAKAFAKAEHCLFLRGKPGVRGCGNYKIHLMNGRDIHYTLFLMDSNGKRRYGTRSGWDYIHPSQIKWYRKGVESTRRPDGSAVDSLVFFHIPLPEYEPARQMLCTGRAAGFGVFGEEISCPERNTGFFEVMQELGSTKAVFCGHDHLNHCDIEYEGIRLNFCLKSSRSSYFDEALLGVTTVTVAADNTLEIRQHPFP